MFRIWRWENDAVPDVGSDVQSIVTGQMPHEIDIVIGIFWSRLGTPTPRASSGSVEEIENAISLRADQTGPQVSVYFKKSNIPIDADLDQIAGVREFEKSLNSRAFIGSFDEIQQFEAQIEKLLDRYAESLQGLEANRKPLPPLEPVARQSRAQIDEDVEFDDFGFFDLVEIFVENLEKSREFLNSATDEINKYAKKTDEITEKIEDIRKFGQVDYKMIKPLLKKVAENMNQLSAFIDERIDDYAVSFLKASEVSGRIIELSGDFDNSPEGSNEYRVNIIKLIDGARQSIASTREFCDTVSSMPRVDISTNQAKRRLTATLERMIDATKAGIERFDSDVSPAS